MPLRGLKLVNPISTLDQVSVNLTKNAEYERLVSEEIEHYTQIEVTENLTEGGVHAFKTWEFNYNFLYSKIFKTNFYDEVVHHANQVESPRLLSLGCGYGGHDLQIARRLKSSYEITALDLNPSLFQEATRRARLEGLNIQFRTADLNFIDIQPASFNVIYAVASIHHILNLEHLFEAIHRGLTGGGVLVITDLIGQRQVLHWKENVEFAAELIQNMPRRYRPHWTSRWSFWTSRFDPYSILPRYVEPALQVGMEGIRQEEIEALLDRWFVGRKTFRYNAFMRLICTNPFLGQRLNPQRYRDRRYLERLARLDCKLVQSGKLKPTELFGVFAKRA
jgi:SAM-dependent methyltransferase